MWTYEKRLEYPVKIARVNPATAKIIITQYGGPNGEAGAALRYLSQRYSMPDRRIAGILTDIGTEELAHLEIISAMVHQLTRHMTAEQIKAAGFEDYFVDHAASGTPFSATTFQSVGDAIADLNKDLAAEQKARVTYDNLISLIEDPDVLDPPRFLRERGIVHYQRFGEGLELMKEQLDATNFYAINPSFDKKVPR